MKKHRDMILEDEPPMSESVPYPTGEEQKTITNRSRKNEATGPKQKWNSVVNVSGGENKVWLCKEQYCIRIWNLRFMNQGKSDVVQQEMAKVNIDILGISELKWTRMGEFNSDDHYIYYCGQESLGRNGVALVVNWRVQNTVLGYSLKKDRIILVHFQGKPFNITVIQVIPLPLMLKELKLNSSMKTYKTF